MRTITQNPEFVRVVYAPYGPEANIIAGFISSIIVIAANITPDLTRASGIASKLQGEANNSIKFPYDSDWNDEAQWAATAAQEVVDFIKAVIEFNQQKAVKKSSNKTTNSGFGYFWKR